MTTSSVPITIAHHTIKQPGFITRLLITRVQQLLRAVFVHLVDMNPLETPTAPLLFAKLKARISFAAASASQMGRFETKKSAAARVYDLVSLLPQESAFGPISVFTGFVVLALAFGLFAVRRQSTSALPYERLVYAEDGGFLTGSFADYAVPTASMIPELEILHRESPSPVTPLGAKGVAEGKAQCGAPPQAAFTAS